jgi:exodeoxyribonuclease VII large subunit
VAAEPGARPAGIRGSRFPGPWPAGTYAAKLRDHLKGIARVQVFGEVWGLRTSRAKVYFELRDAGGALPCSMWRDDWDRLGGASVGDGAQVVAGGGPDYYVGSRTSSPSFTFLVTELRVAGEGDLLAQVDRLRRLFDAEGLLLRQRELHRPTLPRTIGVVTGEGGKARDDVLAGLRRRGWAGRLVWGFAPVQDRHAAPRIAQALRDLVAYARPDVIVVARGGGSLADLFAFCDEALCRTVAHLPVPVIASVGHHTDRTLIDDVAAVACSTPTHAAETAVGIDVAGARETLRREAVRLRGHGRRAVLERARVLVRMSRAPEEHVARHRRRLHQQIRELRASARRRGAVERELTSRRALVLDRKAATAAGPDLARRQRELERLRLALEAHDPERTLARGYALVEDRAGEPLGSAAAARAARDVRLRFHDGDVEGTVR